MGTPARQICINTDCKATYSAEQVIFSCARCGALLDIDYDWDAVELPGTLRFFETRWGTPGRSNRAMLDFSGVWRFRELLPFASRSDMVTAGEGRTLLQQADLLASELGMKPGCLYLQHEGLNPSGSFKDNGMAAAFTMARRVRRKRVACASTGNTSASMALYAAAGSTPQHAFEAFVFIGSGKIAKGKLAQILDFGAVTFQIEGDFDNCMKRVQQATEKLDLYLLNSVNPYRLEGQKAIMYRILEGLNWEIPDWIVVPGGNLGNAAAFGKAWKELETLGLVGRIPRLAIINAQGANTLALLYNEDNLRWNGGHIDADVISRRYRSMEQSGFKPRTVATAIEISHPLNLPKALRSLDQMNGVVCEVDDQSILEHKALVGRTGLGCEPASATSVAGLHRLLEEQIITPNERVVCVLTGHALKDPDTTVSYHLSKKKSARHPHANKPMPIKDDLGAICWAIENH